MPQHRKQGGRALWIELDNPAAPLYPGSVVRGRVVRKKSIYETIDIHVRLLGRAKANDNNGSRMRSPFWKPDDVSAALRNNFARIPVLGGPRSWEFELTLPMTSQSLINPEMGQQEPEGFVGPRHPLPPSHVWGNAHFIEFIFGFVEYWIEAEMESTTRGCRWKATLPLHVRATPPPAAISDFGMRSLSFPRVVKYPKDCFLENTYELRYNILVDCPSVLQFGAAIPFEIKLMLTGSSPVRDLTNVEPRVFITGAKFKFLTETQILDPSIQQGRLVTYKARPDKWISDRTARTHGVRDAIAVPVGQEKNPVNLGQVIGLWLDANRRLRGARFRVTADYSTLVQYVPPDFTACSVKTRKMLSYEVQFSISGRPVRISSSQAVTLVPPASRVTVPVVEEPVVGFADRIPTPVNEGPIGRSTPTPLVEPDEAPSKYDGVEGSVPSFGTAGSSAGNDVVGSLGDERRDGVNVVGHDAQEEVPATSMRNLSIDRSNTRVHVSDDILNRFTSNHMFVAD